MKKIVLALLCLNFSAAQALTVEEFNKQHQQKQQQLFASLDYCSNIGSQEIFNTGTQTLDKIKADLEIIKASELAIQSGADFIKTSTGFGTDGATLHDIKLMKSVANNTIKIKASGGIKDKKTALNFINHGANRLGTSSGIAIVTGKASNSNY